MTKIPKSTIRKIIKDALAGHLNALKMYNMNVGYSQDDIKRIMKAFDDLGDIALKLYNHIKEYY